jgi:hypothetical protein
MTRSNGAKAWESLAQPARTASRFGAAIVGGYLFAYGFTALATLTGFAIGLPFSEAQVLAWMLGALVYLCAMLWGFVLRTATMAWAVLAGGGAAMGAAAWTLSRLAD